MSHLLLLLPGSNCINILSLIIYSSPRFFFFFYYYYYFPSHLSFYFSSILYRHFFFHCFLFSSFIYSVKVLLLLTYCSFLFYCQYGGVAQMVEHSLCMRGAAGSMPATSIFFNYSCIVLFPFSFFFFWILLFHLLSSHFHCFFRLFSCLVDGSSFFHLFIYLFIFIFYIFHLFLFIQLFSLLYRCINSPSLPRFQKSLLV